MNLFDGTACGIGFNVADCIWDNIQEYMKNLGFSLSVLDWLSGLISLAINMLATGLIAWKAWQVFLKSR